MNFIKQFLLLSCLSLYGMVSAQRHELGVFLGQNTLVGDIGDTNYLMSYVLGADMKPANIPIYFGGFYKRNINPYQGVRVSAAYNKVYFDDSQSNQEYRVKRNISGSNTVLEASAMFEYNFLPINDDLRKGNMMSPYIVAGVGAIAYNTAQMAIRYQRDGMGGYELVQGYPRESYDKQTLAISIPFGIGLKYKTTRNFTFYLEALFRATFVDDIDLSKVRKENIQIFYDGKTTMPAGITSEQMERLRQLNEQNIKQRTYGNPNSNDWLNSLSVGVSYSFGRPACYCN